MLALLTVAFWIATLAEAADSPGKKVHSLLIIGATGEIRRRTCPPTPPSQTRHNYVGTGKSTLAGTLATHLGFTGETPFATSDEIHAHTQAPISLVVGDIKITFVGLALSDPSRSLQLSSRSSFIRDTPGLMDTAGLDKDMRNMGLIVKSVSHSVAA